jgi:hypothetical protein
MEMLPPSPSVGDVPDDDETAQTTALIAQVPRIALEELARRMLENPGSVSRADFEAAVGRDERDRRWKARYKDANGKNRHVGYYNTQEAAAYAVNAAIRRAGLEGRRRTNPVVDGALVPNHSGAPTRIPKKRRRDEPAAATPSTRARRPRRAVNYDDSGPDDEEDLELGPPDADDGWD